MIYNDENLRHVLTDLMKENNLSMRKLSERTGIDTAIISKIMNGKRKATLEHLYRFAESLNVPVTSFIEAADPQSSVNRGENRDPMAFVQDFLENSEDFTEVPTIDLIEERLSAYENYSLTDKGKQTIFNQFKNKLNNIGGKGSYIQQLEMMFERFRHKQGTKKRTDAHGKRTALFYFYNGCCS